MIRQGEIFQLYCPNCGRHLVGVIDDKRSAKIECGRCGTKIISKCITPKSCKMKISAQ